MGNAQRTMLNWVNLDCKPWPGMYSVVKPGTAKSVNALIEAVVRGQLDEAQTLRLCTQSPELATLALHAARKRVGELQG